MEIARTLAQYLKEFLEITGMSVIALSVVFTIIWGAIHYKDKEHSYEETYHKMRRNFGRGILFGLEFLVAADIINSVAVDPSFQSVGLLALIILVRTFLSFALEVEINGKWPWKN